MDALFGYNKDILNMYWMIFSHPVYIFVLVICMVFMFKVFKKARYAGWKALVPIYNLYVLSKIAIGNGWYFILLFIPLINIFAYIYINIKLAKCFGKSILFSIGLIILNPVFIAILALGNSEYRD